MDKRTLELLHSKLTDLDSKIAEISSLRQQIYDILKDHESMQQAAQDLAQLESEAASKEEDATVIAQPQDAIENNDDNVSNDLISAEDNAIDSDIDTEADADVFDKADDNHSQEDKEDEQQKVAEAKEEIEREAISLEAQKLMHSAPDDVESMLQADQAAPAPSSSEDDTVVDQGMVEPQDQSMDIFDPNIIPAKELDKDLDVGQDSDLAKINDAFAQMDQIESQQDIDRMEQQLDKEHDHTSLISEATPSEPEKTDEAKADTQNEAQPKVVETIENAEEPVTESAQSEPVQTQTVQTQYLQIQPVEEVEEEEAVFVQPRPLQHTPSQATTTHPSNEGTRNGAHSSGLKVDEMLSRQNSRNLYKAFTLNDKFRFRRELFHGKDSEMAEAIDRVCVMDNYTQAEDYFYETLGLNPNNEDVKDFMLIIKNHFA